MELLIELRVRQPQSQWKLAVNKARGMATNIQVKEPATKFQQPPFHTKLYCSSKFKIIEQERGLGLNIVICYVRH